MAVFAFKDFTVRQERSPLKVSTDAILLGVSVQLPQTTTKVLDVGTGSGVIALLLASRFAKAQFTGIDPDEGAFADAQFNFSRAKFAPQLSALHCALESLPNEKKYDVIVSNPPYFLDSLPSQMEAAQTAKHISRQAFFALFEEMMLRCKEDGQIWLILPAELALQTQAYFEQRAWGLAHKLQFHANPAKPNKLWVLCLQKNAQMPSVKDYMIRDADGSYHADYRKLAGPFHDRPL